MQLWTDYEGRTIDDFPLKKLLRPEGRSAFYSTATGKGDPTVIRLIESHFDEDEILTRWRGVEALGHPNVLKLEHFDQTTVDDTSVLYAVMEPVEANLDEVLASHRIAVSEVCQLAASLASALDALHTHGFVHEHIEPANVFAIGEVVKLRSDCIREAPEGEDGRRAKRRDVHDLAILLLLALTQQRTLEAASRFSIPAPLDEIVSKGMNGEWGLAEITAALESPTQTRNSRPRPEPSASDAPVSRPAVPATGNGTNVANHSTPARPLPLPFPEPAAAKPPLGDAPPLRIHLLFQERLGIFQNRLRVGDLTARWILAAAGLALILILWLGFHLTHRHSADQAAPPANSSPALDNGTPAQADAGLPAADAAATQGNSTSSTRRDWRVIAFTYNREDQARKKASTVAARHPDLHPQVFSPTGRGPYLVSLGGAMNRDQAFAMAGKARAEGLPNDTYAQNYPNARH